MFFKFIIWFLWIFVAISALFGIVVIYQVFFTDQIFNPGCDTNSGIASEFGSFFGGYVGTIFAITSTFLILVTLLYQNLTTAKANTANKFFRMLDYHSENVRQLEVSDIKSRVINNENNVKKIKGRRAFVIFKMQILELLKEVRTILDENNLKLSNYEVIDITYMAFFYGIDKRWEEFLNKRLNKYPESKLITQGLIAAKERSVKKIGRTNQTSLSSYFRNMYNAIKLIDTDTYLNKDEKKKYVKIFRAQLSNPELFVLFFNVVSRFGKKWHSNNFIIKYEFLKNLPLDYLEEFNPRDFFKINYEEEELY